MKFYNIGQTLENLIRDDICRPFVRIEIDRAKTGEYEYLSDSDIEECSITSYKEKTGGIVNCGVLVLSNEFNQYSPLLNPDLVPGIQFHIWYCMGNNYNSFLRFSLYADDSGFQCYGKGKDKKVLIHLVDYSYYLKQSNKERDWTSDLVVAHSVICDKTNPNESLFHRIAERGGLQDTDIDCAYLPFTLPYVRITENVWSELSLLASAYKAHLECSKDRMITFAHSRYDTDYEEESPIGFTLTDEDVFEYRKFVATDRYKNTLRMKWTKYKEIERTVLWKYHDEPVLYDENIEPYYPFIPRTRDIEKYENYEAPYTYTDPEGKNHTVVYAEDIDTQEDFEANLLYEGSSIDVKKYNTTLHTDKALVQLEASGPVNLRQAIIHGKGIIPQHNYSHFISDVSEVENRGTKALNITNKYMSDDELNGRPFYEMWAEDTLQELKDVRRGYFIKTNKALFHARAGACIQIELSDACGISEQKALIEELVLRYKKSEAFETAMTVLSTGV